MSQYNIPCVILIATFAWLGVSLYFATSNWLNLVRTNEVWGDARDCKLTGVKLTDCRYSTRKGEARSGCRAEFFFQDLPQPYLHDVSDRKGCTFRNCAAARRWANARIPETPNTTSCWVRRSVNINTSAANATENNVIIDDPAGSSKRDAIISVISAAVASVVAVIGICSLISIAINKRRTAL